MDPSPSIALVVHDCQIGYGQGRYVVELLRRLSHRYRFTVFASRFDADLPPGVDLRRVPALRFNAISTIFSFLAASEAMVRRSRFDLIHPQGLSCWAGDVITVHMCNAARYAHAPARTVRGRLFPALIIPIERAFFRARSRRHAIVMANVLGHEIRDHYGWRKPLTVIPHGTDTHRFRPATDDSERVALRRRYGLQASDWVWLFVGDAAKGLGQVIDQLAAFTSARLLVVSRSAPQAFLDRAASLAVSDRLVWHGADVEPELAFRASDVFVFPSHYDPFGMVVTEAMASSLPVIVSQHIGAAELIEHRRNGWLIDHQKASELQGALAWVRDHPAEAGRLGAAGRLTALEYSWERCAARTSEVYDGLLTGRSQCAAQA